MNYPIALIHEHVTIDLSAAKHDPDARQADFEASRAELSAMAAKGLRLICDQTNLGMGRNPEYCRRMSEATGIEILLATGFYKEPFYPPIVESSSERELSDLMIRELREGIDGSPFKASVIGEIGTGKGRPTELEAKVFRAAARAQAETGAPISTHTTLGELGLEQIAILRGAGADTSRVVLSHTDLKNDFDYLLALLDEGVSLSFDTIGKKSYLPDQTRADFIARLFKRGYGDKIMLSLDITRRSHLADRGGIGYSYLVDSFLPLLRERGVAEEDIGKAISLNASRFLGKELSL